MKNIGLFEGSGKNEAVEWAETTAFKLKAYGAECCAQPELIEKFDEELKDYIKPLAITEFEKFADILISFGGDGTILSASREMIHADIPVMGFNVGRLGFLAEFSVKELDTALEDLMKGNYRVLNRSILETDLNEEKIYALNDFVIEKRDSSHMINIKVWANGHFIGDYRADGLIVATPTGSTAYSLSSGGPIIAPNTNVICLTPISPHSLTFRPLVIPDSNELRLQIESPDGSANLVADGQIKRVLNNNESVILTLSDLCIKLIKPHKGSYYDLLRNKLLWAVNAEAGNKEEG